MKIIHEKNKCIGCGACAAICSKMFEMDESGIAQLKNSAINPETKNYEIEIDDPSCVKDAAESCPVEVIHLVLKK